LEVNKRGPQPQGTYTKRALASGTWRATSNKVAIYSNTLTLSFISAWWRVSTAPLSEPRLCHVWIH